VYWVLDSQLPAVTDPKTAEQLRRGVEQQAAAADDLSYVAELKRKHRAEILNSPQASSAGK
jgi:hypothetical protein